MFPTLFPISLDWLYPATHLGSYQKLGGRGTYLTICVHTGYVVKLYFELLCNASCFCHSQSSLKSIKVNLLMLFSFSYSFFTSISSCTGFYVVQTRNLSSRTWVTFQCVLSCPIVKQIQTTLIIVEVQSGTCPHG